MAMVELYTDIGLSISRVQVKLDEKTPNNDLVVRSDGLYVSGDYNDGSGDIRLQSNQINYLIATDMSPWEEAYDGDNSAFKNHVTCDCTTHRCWNAVWSSENPDEDTSDEEESTPESDPNNNEEPSSSDEPETTSSSGMRKVTLVSGKNENDKFRKEIDWVLPGDFFRIKNGDQWDYYVITEVAPGEGQDICSGCGQVVFKYNGYCEHGNPNYYYDKEKNTHYTLDPPMENPNEYDAPEICPICGQPILKPKADIDDPLIGYPGNEIVSYALLGTAGDY
jgi:hypothetical protein